MWRAWQLYRSIIGALCHAPGVFKTKAPAFGGKRGNKGVTTRKDDDDDDAYLLRACKECMHTEKSRAMTIYECPCTGMNVDKKTRSTQIYANFLCAATCELLSG